MKSSKSLAPLILILLTVVNSVQGIPIYGMKFNNKAPLQSTESVPRKLYHPHIKKPHHSNEATDLRIVMWDNENHPVSAKKNYLINVIIQPPGNRPEIKATYPIVKDSSGTTFIFTPQEAGVYKIICTNPEMLPAEWMLNVLPSKKVGYLEADRQSVFKFASSQAQLHKAQVLVYLQEEKEFLADGTDFAEISFLIDDPDSVFKGLDSVRVLLNNLNGTLSRKEVYVNKINFESARLTSSFVGPVTVEFNCPNPKFQMNKASAIIKFSAAVDHFELSLNPPQINLFDFCDIMISLKNKNSITIATDRLISGSLGIVSGNGRFENDNPNLNIPIGGANSLVKFQPIGSGLVTIRAELVNLPPQLQNVEVTWPWLLIGLASGFGLVGSWSAYKREKTKPITVLFGLVTGLALYWAVLFFLPTSIPHAIVLNPLSALVIGTCGGFAGTEVLRLILKTVGVAV